MNAVEQRSHAWVWHVIILAHVAAGLVGVALLALPGSSHHRRVQLGLDLRGGVQVVLRAVPPPGHRLTPEDMDRSLLVMRNRIDKIGVSGAELRKQGTDAIVIQLAGVHDPATAAALIGQTAQLEIYDLEPNLLAGPVRSAAALHRRPHTVVIRCGRSETHCPGVSGRPARTWFYLFRHTATVPEMRGTDLDFSDTGSGYEPKTHRYFVDFGLKSPGVRKFRRLTAAEAARGRARGRIQHAAFVLDGEIRAFPGLDYRRFPDGIRSPTGASIAGLRTSTEAYNLGLVLQTGSLPIGFRQIERTEISATLGRDSLHQAVRAAAYALILIALFLLVLYRLLGVVAIVGLAVYAAFIYGIVLLLGVSVTLPGFAGLILAIAVAADANVVIFERIKEEVRGGRRVPEAIERGYDRGFRTIVDANVVTGITALVLFLVATALVKGFALLLLIGTLISIMTAVATTRALLGLLGDAPWLGRPSLIGAGPPRFRRPQIDFVGRRAAWLAFSGAVVAAGAVSLAVQGLDFGIDFRSGSQFTFATAQPRSTDAVRSVAASFGRSDAEILGRGASTGGRYRSFEVRTRLLTPAQTRAFQRDLRQRVDAQSFGVSSVSSSFGRQIAKAALWALLGSLVLIVLYIGKRFDFVSALPVLIALLHDVFITVGVYSLSGREVTSASVAAVLTVLGYSIYDTLIIFDRIRENAARMRRSPYAELVNLSLAQTISRSLATTFITLLPIAALLAFGGATLTGFAFALLVGVASGAYSSIFIAAPLLSLLKERSWKQAEPLPEHSPEAVLAALAAFSHRWREAYGDDGE